MSNLPRGLREKTWPTQNSEYMLILNSSITNLKEKEIRGLGTPRERWRRRAELPRALPGQLGKFWALDIVNAPLTEHKPTWSARFSLLSAKCPGIVPSRPALACVTALAAQGPKTTYALGSAGSGPCQPGPLVVRGIAAGELGLELE